MSPCEIKRKDGSSEFLNSNRLNLFRALTSIVSISYKNSAAQRWDSSDMNDELFERLAAIEHERWSDWQRYVHARCAKIIETGETGEEVLREVKIPLELFHQWERQINTPYSELSEEEKESDRDQVRRYWNLINPESG